MCPTEVVVDRRSHLVGNDAEGNGLAVLLIDGGRKHAVAVLGHAGEFHGAGPSAFDGLELSVGVNCADPIECAYAKAGVLRSDGEEIATVAHRGDIGHLPECAVRRDIGALEEERAVVAPVACALVVLVQGAAAYASLARTYDDVGTMLGAEEEGIAEVVAETSGTTVDAGIVCSLGPVDERGIGG